MDADQGPEVAAPAGWGATISRGGPGTGPAGGPQRPPARGNRAPAPVANQSGGISSQPQITSRAWSTPSFDSPEKACTLTVSP